MLALTVYTIMKEG